MVQRRLHYRGPEKSRARKGLNSNVRDVILCGYLPEDRPLNSRERNLVEREGLCIGCHQYQGTAEWKGIIRKYGRAETAEQHEKIVSEAIKSLMDKSKLNLGTKIAG